MAEIHPFQQEGLSNGGGAHPPPAVPIPVPAPAVSSIPWLPTATAAENVTSKRQRRPSVRLGEIGDQPAATATLFHDGQRRTKQQQWRASNKDPGKTSKTRQLAKLAGGGVGIGGGGHHETLDSEEGEKEANFDDLAIGSWRTKDSKSKRAVKRPRTMWLPKIEEGGGEGGEKFSGGSGRGCDGDDDIDGFARDFEPLGSETPSKELSPAHSLENLAVDIDRRGHGSELQFRRPHRGARDLEDHHHHRHLHVDNDHDGVNVDGRSDNNRNGGHNNSDGGRLWGCSQEGVKIWLNGLGLGRYWPVFKIHEVDEEVLPMLTLEDLKDMGINAVGSRRKMYSAIQKLGRGFS